MPDPFFYGCWPVRPEAKPSIELEYFDRGPSLLLECTQLSGTASRQTKIIAEWCSFFTSSTDIVDDLYVSTRIPVRLFDAICEHRGIRKLGYKWGPIKDLSPISNLQGLTHLGIGSCSITDLSPVGSLDKLEMLSIENADRVSDYSPLGDLHKLEFLHIDGSPHSSNKKIPMESLEFIGALDNLRGLSVGYAKIEDKEWPNHLIKMDRLEQLFVPESTPPETRASILKSLPNLKLHNLG